MTAARKEGASLRGQGVCETTAPVIKLALKMGYHHHVIAGYLNDNQGRVSETNTHKRHPDAPVADVLPPDSRRTTTRADP